MKNKKSNFGIILIAVLIVVMVSVMFRTNQNIQTHKYSEIIQLFNNKQVTAFTLNLNNGDLKITTKNNDTSAIKASSDVTYRIGAPTWFMEDVKDDIEKYNKENPSAQMEYDIIPATDNSGLFNIGFMVVSFLVLGGFWFFIMRQATGGAGKAMSINKSKMKASDPNNKTTFADVAGAEEEKEELEEIVDFLKNPQRYTELGAKIPCGVLLVGPPGTGKTLLARACAGEAGVPFYSISGSDFVEMYVGVGAKRVRELFETAKKASPSIVFIDEIDAVGRQRGAGLGGGHDEREQTLNQLLVEMDGFGANEGVIVIAATNRADILDNALLRPGRFDRQVYVGYPDVKGREEILKVHTRNKPLGPDVNLNTIARSTVGFTGADLANLVNEAALLAVKKGRKAITEIDIEESSVKVMMGAEKRSRVVSDKEKKLVAYHEGGHAIASYFCEYRDPVHQISIIPRGGAGGYTMYIPENDDSLRTKKRMLDDMVGLLGGRVAEKLVLEDISTGASSDLKRATAIARSMVTRYGFSEKLGPVVYDGDPHETFLGKDLSNGKSYSENIAFEIDEEVRTMLDDAYDRCTDILSEHMDKLHKLAEVLLEKETISGEEFIDVMEGREIVVETETSTEEAEITLEQEETVEKNTTVETENEKKDEIENI